MPDAVERLVNLAMFLAEARSPVTAEQLRSRLEGYPADQDDDAFIRMFERDKDELRAMGFRIESDNSGRYWLDSENTFAEELSVSTEDVAVIRLVGAALLDDPAFPFKEALRFALAKISASIEMPDAPVLVRMADEAPEDQGEAVSALDRAATMRKCVDFDYTNSHGEEKHHRVEIYGLFTRDGRWYTVGRDTALDEVRVYTVSRLSGLVVDTARPKTPDFERPAEFNVAAFIHLPFQYGPEKIAAKIRFDSGSAWRAPTLTAGIGSLASSATDGSVTWSVVARDSNRLMRWIIENGPGIGLMEPVGLIDRLDAGLEIVVASHDRGSR